MGSIPETNAKAILDLENVEFTNLQIDQSDEIKDFSILLDELFSAHYFAKISIDYSEIEGPGFGIYNEEYFRNLLNSHNFKKLIPELEPFDYEYKFDRPLAVDHSLFPLFCDLCEFIDSGGAYASVTLTPDELIAKIKAFIDVFLPYGFKGYSVFTTHERWTNYFYDLGWDRTFVAFDVPRNELNIISITDRF